MQTVSQSLNVRVRSGDKLAFAGMPVSKLNTQTTPYNHTATARHSKHTTQTHIPHSYGGLDRPWVPDVVGRAWGNRGNARSRQGKLQEALSDYNTAIALCPWSVDPGGLYETCSCVGCAVCCVLRAAGLSYRSHFLTRTHNTQC